MKSICHQLRITAPAETVYNALTSQQGLAAWWTPDTIATPETGSVSRFAFGPTYFKEIKVTALERPVKVEWLCLKGQAEWVGTTITFELQSDDKGTRLSFHHDGWKDYTPEFAGCSYDWAMFLRSLRILCETGKGLPFPNQHLITA